jgi:cellulose synthase/poly-beta-1,6-N-acetylglucosamine synthase-like glycosyltransferase
MTTSARPNSRYQYLTDQKWFIRLLDIIPGFLTWTVLLAPIVVSLFQPLWVAYFIIAFDLYWLIKAFRISGFLVRGYRKLHYAQKLDWAERLDWLRRPEYYVGIAERRLSDLLRAHPKAGRRWQLSRVGQGRYRRFKVLSTELDELRGIQDRQAAILNPDDLYHLVIMAAYNEGPEILEPSVRALLEANYPPKKLMLVIAYEERGPESTQQTARDLIERYGSKFAYATAIGHPDGIPGEVQGGGKGPNITYAGRIAAAELGKQGYDPEQIIVTTFDSDHRAGAQYFSYLAYAYATDPNRIHKSYQPIPMFYNNIWDAPAPMRVIATNNSFWVLVEAMRPHRLRNFAAHAQPLRALLDTDFWSVETIVEDGHQFWRTYFTYDGDHKAVPLYVPVYQDAVLADTYFKTFVAQYKQLRRWAWGVSDFGFVVRNAIRNPRIPWRNKSVQIWRLFDGHFSWATAAILIGYVAWAPLFLNPQFGRTQELAHQLPVIASYLQNVALIGLIITIAISIISLPPRPARYGRRRNVAMVLQWALLPVVSIAFSALAAIDSQTRLMLGRSLNFDVTPKSRRK